MIIFNWCACTTCRASRTWTFISLLGFGFLVLKRFHFLWFRVLEPIYLAVKVVEHFIKLFIGWNWVNKNWAILLVTSGHGHVVEICHFERFVWNFLLGITTVNKDTARSYKIIDKDSCVSSVFLSFLCDSCVICLVLLDLIVSICLGYLILKLLTSLLHYWWQILHYYLAGLIFNWCFILRTVTNNFSAALGFPSNFSDALWIIITKPMCTFVTLMMRVTCQRQDIRVLIRVLHHDCLAYWAAMQLRWTTSASIFPPKVVCRGRFEFLNVRDGAISNFIFVRDVYFAAFFEHFLGQNRFSSAIWWTISIRF